MMARQVSAPIRNQGHLQDTVSEQARYPLPEGFVGLNGPVDRPEPGTLPLRGDLAHIALANHYLAAHYVVPLCRTIGAEAVVLKLAMRDDAGDGARLDAGTPVEVLDTAGKWAWIACGPQGPSGYVLTTALAPDAAVDDAA